MGQFFSDLVRLFSSFQDRSQNQQGRSCELQTLRSDHYELCVRRISSSTEGLG